MPSNQMLRPLLPTEQKDLDKFLEYMSHERYVTKGTLMNYCSDIRRLLAEQDPRQMNFEGFRAHMAALSKQEIKQTTIKRKLTAYRMFWRWMIMEGLVKENIADRFTMPYRQQPIPRYMSVDQLRRFVDARDPNPNHWLAWRLLAWTGMRRDEVRMMRVSALKFNDDQIIIVNAKGHKDRRIPMPPALKNELLGAVHGKSDDALVFVGFYGGVWNLKTFYYDWKRQLSRAGLKGFTPHSLRHTYITLLANEGIRDVTLQALSGHADPRSLNRYRHANPEAVREAALLFPLNM